MSLLPCLLPKREWSLEKTLVLCAGCLLARGSTGATALWSTVHLRSSVAAAHRRQIEAPCCRPPSTAFSRSSLRCSSAQRTHGRRAAKASCARMRARSATAVRAARGCERATPSIVACPLLTCHTVLPPHLPSSLGAQLGLGSSAGPRHPAVCMCARHSLISTHSPSRSRTRVLLSVSHVFGSFTPCASDMRCRCCSCACAVDAR
jgi:hypothetical protein